MTVICTAQLVNRSESELLVHSLNAKKQILASKNCCLADELKSY